MGFLIRPVEAADIAAMITVFQRSVWDVAIRDYSEAQTKAWAPEKIDVKAWQDNFLSHPTFVAVQGEEVIGFSDLQATGHLDMMFVAPHVQGQGVAKALYEAVEQQAYDQALAKITVHASLTARGFFEKQGFQVEKQQEVERNGQVFTNFRMEKILGSF